MSNRKLLRQNTFHLRGTCPNCGNTNVRFYKDLVFKDIPNQHNKWYCKRCHKTFKREDFKNVKYV